MPPDFHPRFARSNRTLAGALLLGLLSPPSASAYNASLKAQAHQYFAGEAYQCLPSSTPDQQAVRTEFAPYIGQRILWNAAGKNNQTVDGQEAWTGQFWTYTGDGEANPATGLPYTSGYPLQSIDMTDDSSMSNLTLHPANDVIEGSFAEDYRDGLTGHAVPTGGVEQWEFWDHHFWNPESDDDGEFSDDFGGGNGSAVNRAETYWRGTIVPHYDEWVLTGDPAAKGLAYGYLGRTVHLLEDISGPDHAHNDGHIPADSEDEWELPGLAFGGCGFEDYTSIHYADYQGSAALAPVSYRIDDPVDPFMSKARQEWNAHGFPSAWRAAKAPLFWLFYSQAEYANDYPSNDEDGENPGYNSSAYLTFADDWTWTNSWVGKAFADDLVPTALRHVAGLYRLFYDTTHPIQGLVVNNGVVGRTPMSWFSGGLATDAAFYLNHANAAGGMPFQLSLRPGLPYASIALVARSSLYRDPSQALLMYNIEKAMKLVNPASRHPAWKVLYSASTSATEHIASLALPEDGDYDLYLEVTYRADPFALVDDNGHHGSAYTVHQRIGRVLLDRVAPMAPTTVTGPVQTAQPFVSVTWSYGQSPAMASFEALVSRDTGNPNVIGTEVYSEQTAYQGITTPMPLEDGKYVVRVRARDIVGNTSAWTLSNVIHVDTTHPKLALTTPRGASPYSKWDASPLFRVAGWTHDWSTGVGLRSLQVWNDSRLRSPVYPVDSSVLLPGTVPPTTELCTGLCPIPIELPEPVPSWEDTHQQPFAYDVTVYDGPNSLHVRAEDLLGHVTELVLEVNYSAPRTSLHPGLQRTPGQ
ncbi:hypothetical protein CYFUS_008735 [Cystobacter fuscus]|uniref:Fibronectin type-III domain-containing protein n=1 Tax=Cystobacter fuscus TaxID=43 RepID=A0A250JH99_9BACT|nr:hypothetical protein [Cystobacter fuscus]ATB43255.1 hypothetical protein CYFUS_008735 [Cystobacter fuscus]